MTSQGNALVKEFPRDASVLMDIDRLGSLHQSYLSFSRSLIRKMIRESWKISTVSFGLDREGFGLVIYEIHPGGEELYSFVVMTQYLPDDLRNDRVIAQAWDISCCLCQGRLNKKDIEFISTHLPHQEEGFFNEKILTLTRANKSMRIFNAVVEKLAQGIQPDFDLIEKTGYLVRTTAVYGNGKFGLKDFEGLVGTSLSSCFHAQMLTVYLVRYFTLQWVEYLARVKNPSQAVPLDKNRAKFFGVGNSTGLGMLPFLIKHPHLVNQWCHQRELAITQIMSEGLPDKSRIEIFESYLSKAVKFFSHSYVPDPEQKNRNQILYQNLKSAQRFFLGQNNEKNDLQHLSWREIRDKLMFESVGQQAEYEEFFYHLLMEVYPEISEKYDDFSLLQEPWYLDPAEHLADCQELLKKNYDWAINLDFNHLSEAYYFWYYSEEKEEPRLGLRGKDIGVEKEMKIDVARQVNQLSQTMLKDNPKSKVLDFLLTYPKMRPFISRVQTLRNFPYAEIRANVLSQFFSPLHILRFKLSFFGAVKFDPKSQLWLRITLFQGAPLVGENGQLEKEDDWFCYVIDKGT